MRDRFFVRIPLIFISGVFIPLNRIPSVGQFVTYGSPLTYGNDLIHAAYPGTTTFGLFADIIATLCLFILNFQLAANRLYRKFNK